MNEPFERFDFRKDNFQIHYVKNQGLSNAQFRIEIASELCISNNPCLFTHEVQKHKYVYFFISSTNEEKQSFKHIHIHRCCTQPHGILDITICSPKHTKNTNITFEN